MIMNDNQPITPADGPAPEAAGDGPAMYQSLLPGNEAGDAPDDPTDGFLADRPFRRLFFEEDQFNV